LWHRLIVFFEAFAVCWCFSAFARCVPELFSCFLLACFVEAAALWELVALWLDVFDLWLELVV
jgi:hypothetical protein